MSQTKAKWEARVAAWRASGEDTETFTQELGYAGSTLRYWAGRLRREAAGAIRDAASVSTSEPSGVRMVRVTAAPATTRPASSPLVVHVGDACIHLQSGFDPVLLRAAVDALGGAR